LAEFIARHESLKATTRFALFPVVGFARLTLRYPDEARLCAVALFLVVGLLLVRRKDE